MTWPFIWALTALNSSYLSVIQGFGKDADHSDVLTFCVCQVHASPGILYVNSSHQTFLVTLCLTQEPSKPVVLHIQAPRGWDGLPIMTIEPSQVEFFPLNASNSSWSEPSVASTFPVAPDLPPPQLSAEGMDINLSNFQRCIDHATGNAQSNPHFARERLHLI